MIIRQGDVFIERIEKLPDGLTKVELDRTQDIILQDSETSGKGHHFNSNAAVDIYQELDSPIHEQSITPDYGKFMVVTDDNVELFHGSNLRSPDYHHPINLPPGVYRIGITPEYDEEEIMQVVD